MALIGATAGVGLAGVGAVPAGLVGGLTGMPLGMLEGVVKEAWGKKNLLGDITVQKLGDKLEIDK